MERRDKIMALTSLRFFAALWVMLYHTLPRASALPNTFDWQFLGLGYTAVSLFFVLSGFILAKVYAGLSGSSDIKRFLVARVARVFPMYLVSLLIDFPRLLLYRIAKVGFAKAILFTGATFAFQAAALQSWIPGFSALNFPSWSISTEAFFYVMFPVVLPLVRRIERNRTRLLLLIALFAIDIVVALIVHRVGEPLNTEAELWRNPALRLPEFLFGVVIAPWAAVGSPTRLRRRGVIPVTSVFTVAIMATIVVTASTLSNARLSEVLLMPAFAAIILIFASTEDGLIKLFSGRPLVLLGEASYALYLLHAPMAGFFAVLGPAYDQWWSPYYVAYVVVTILASLGAHLWIEAPARRWIMRRWDNRHSSAE